MCKVSIIIPIYNVEKYLDKCVESARNQTLKDIEIILVDDESPDNCPQLCEEYARQDSRIKVVHKKNGGLGFARNSGLEVATGEYVTFLDSDDFVDLFTYEHLYSLAKKNKLDAIYYKFRRFTDDKDVRPASPIDEISTFQGDEIKDLMLDIIASEPSASVDHKIACSSCTAMYKLSIIKCYNIIFHSERELISEDLIFNLDFLCYTGRIAFNIGEYYHYRVNPSSLTSAIRTDRIEKNRLLYNYIIDNLPLWELDAIRGKERSQRLFIGYSRSAIKQILSSSYGDKINWLNGILADSIWSDLYNSFEWHRLPLYQKLFFFFSCKKSKLGLYILSLVSR